MGFSYSNTQSDYRTNDNKTAADNFVFLQRFFKNYPEFSKNRFFVSGESYAGIYVPTYVYVRKEEECFNAFVRQISCRISS